MQIPVASTVIAFASTQLGSAWGNRTAIPPNRQTGSLACMTHMQSRGSATNWSTGTRLLRRMMLPFTGAGGSVECSTSTTAKRFDVTAQIFGQNAVDQDGDVLDILVQSR